MSSEKPYRHNAGIALFNADGRVLIGRRFQDDGHTWGVGLEALLHAPRVYGILETFGQRGEAPTYHYGIRFWVIPNRFQIDATRGDQGGGDPDRRFYTLGLRFIF